MRHGNALQSLPPGRSRARLALRNAAVMRKTASPQLRRNLSRLLFLKRHQRRGPPRRRAVDSRSPGIQWLRW